MLRLAKVAVSFVLIAFSFMMEGTPDANAASKLPEPIKAGVAKSFFGWIMVALLQTTGRYGRRAKTSDAVSNSREDAKCRLPPIPPLRLPHGEPLGADDHESDKVQGQRDAKPPRGNVFAFIENVSARVSSHEHFVSPTRQSAPATPSVAMMSQ
jgi:hypothetical protein